MSCSHTTGTGMRMENGKEKKMKEWKITFVIKKKSCFYTYGPDAGLCIRNLYNILDLIIWKANFFNDDN